MYLLLCDSSQTKRKPDRIMSSSIYLRFLLRMWDGWAVLVSIIMRKECKVTTVWSSLLLEKYLSILLEKLSWVLMNKTSVNAVNKVGKKVGVEVGALAPWWAWDVICKSMKESRAFRFCLCSENLGIVIVEFEDWKKKKKGWWVPDWGSQTWKAYLVQKAHISKRVETAFQNRCLGFETP